MTQYYNFLDGSSFQEAGAIAAFVSCAPGKVMLSGADLPGYENSPRLMDLLGFERQGFDFQAAKLCFKAHSLWFKA
jgi:hypothetical protein